ncbi:MAG: hypothetical protein ACLPHP_12605 [Candidatus Sulfotelmatobacter sp.]
MTKLRGCGSLLLMLVSCFAFGQKNPGGQVYRTNEEVRVPQLPALMARSHNLSDVLLTSLDIVFHDPGICCGKDSALEDRAPAADPLSLNDVASRVQGKQVLSDGRAIQITAEVLPDAPGIDISSRIVGSLLDKHAMLMMWNSHLYVLYGAVFDAVANGRSSQFMIHRLFLVDPRYSGQRREQTFNRDTDDWSKVEGILLLTVAPQ